MGGAMGLGFISSPSSRSAGPEASARPVAEHAWSAPPAVRLAARCLPRRRTGQSPGSVFRDSRGGLLSISTAAICADSGGSLEVFEQASCCLLAAEPCAFDPPREAPAAADVQAQIRIGQGAHLTP